MFLSPQKLLAVRISENDTRIARTLHSEWLGLGKATVAAPGSSLPHPNSENHRHLRDQLMALTEAGQAGDEAFLVAVKRMGSLDSLSREFARGG